METNWKCTTFNYPYDVSDSGLVLSLKTGKLLKPFFIAKRYQAVDLRNGGKETNIRIPVHVLVWVTFMGHVTTGHEIDHIDNNNQNNRLDNLQLLTPEENKLKYREFVRKMRIAQSRFASEANAIMRAIAREND